MAGNTTAWVILLVNDIQQSMIFSGAATGDPHLRSSFCSSTEVRKKYLKKSLHRMAENVTRWVII